MATAKVDVLQLLDRLPDDVTLEGIQYHIGVVQTILRGLKDAEDGRVVSHDEVKRRMAKWLSVFFMALAAMPTAAFAQHLGMGFRVGEVTQNSAIVWVRVTKNKERNWTGYRDPTKRERRQREYLPSKVKVADREGAMPGAVGKVRLTYVVGRKVDGVGIVGTGSAVRTLPAVTVKRENDFIHQFHLKDLSPGTDCALIVDLLDPNNGKKLEQQTGAFHVPHSKEVWQNVTFTVVTGQSYWDLDHKDGFHIYPAMAKLKPHFLVPTGDTVYTARGGE